MATSEAGRLLDELMGRYRNQLPNDTDNRISWESSEVCRYYLVKFCPHDLFTNTKSDLGTCEKIHDDEMKREYESSSSHKRLSYEDDFIRYADSMLADVDRRIEKGRQRLALSVQEALANSSTGDSRVDEQILFLSERITGLVSETERLGSEGNVEEAQGISKLCDKLREERDALRKSNENSVWHQILDCMKIDDQKATSSAQNVSLLQAAEMAASQEKQMEVCEICGAFLIVGDAQQRIDDHLTGKQHVGFAKLRQAIKEIRERRDEREKLREKEREERRKNIEDDDRRRSSDGGGGGRRDRDDHYRRSNYDRRDSRHREERENHNHGGGNHKEREYRNFRGNSDHNNRNHRDRNYRESRDREYRPSRDRRRSRSRDRRDND